MHPQALVASAPAKVNLYLAVGSKRADGYHHVDAVLQTVSLSDRIVLEPSDSLELISTGLDPGVEPERNLAWRAAEAMAAQLGIEPHVRITLDKRTPAGAGLGGGSADAAAVLAGTAALWDVSVDEPTLMRLAAGLGADVAFFLVGGAAYFTGRGDRLVRQLPVVDAPIVLVKPEPGVDTAAAYARFDELEPQPGPGVSRVADACRSSDPAALAAALFNNMTSAATSLVPAVAETLAWCGAAPGVRAALVAGSGSSVFGMFEEASAAESAVTEARARGWWAEAVHTTRHGIELRRAEEV